MFRFFSFIFLLFLAAAPVYAQNTITDSETKWWWAWREQTGELLAFNAEGDTNVIAEIETINHFSRLNEDTALAILQTGDEYGLYKLTSQASIQVDYQVDGMFEGSFDYDNSGAYQLLAAEGDYAVISGSSHRELWLFNMITNTLEPLDQLLHTSNHCSYDLSGLPYRMEACLRFSEDGHYLRYIADISSATSEDQFALRERDLATGVEENFYVPTGLPDANSTNIDCESGAYGEQWLCYRYSEFDTYAAGAYWLVNRAGEMRTLIEESLYGGYWWGIYFSRDSLIVNERRCNGECSIIVKPPDGGFAQWFVIPQNTITSDQIYYVVPLSNGNLLLSANSKKYTLTATGELQELGAIYCCEVIDTTSPDYRWIIVATEQGATIWDLERNQEKFTVATSLPITLYTSKGFVINNRWVYFNNDDSLLELSIGENGGIVDMLPERTLLYEQVEANDEFARGIYRYDPETDTYTELVADAVVAWAQNPRFGQVIKV